MFPPKVKPPLCNEPDRRILTAAETKRLFALPAQQCNGPSSATAVGICVKVVALVGCRTTEIASLREEDVLANRAIRMAAESTTTRRYKNLAGFRLSSTPN